MNVSCLFIFLSCLLNWIEWRPLESTDELMTLKKTWLAARKRLQECRIMECTKPGGFLQPSADDTEKIKQAKHDVAIAARPLEQALSKRQNSAQAHVFRKCKQLVNVTSDCSDVCEQ